MAADIASRSFENYDALKALKGMGIGIGGAIAGFILEQAVNTYEYGTSKSVDAIKGGGFDFPYFDGIFYPHFFRPQLVVS
ncbi:hypothetical protein [Frigoriflavimonas asaccharolytica]|uniref:Uncharacterized protein n=1 Tax=Frigoriflavimonas asaccharolytica TaxID=2735899 RepID=A0A8J8GAU7_9FLAO|nr:hypothetical protein [Frigoriflavimonas asaccharolytica]NRS94116.1 hypothetical protein [Frigoriflavimonas asaccharolytica]